MLTNCLIDGTQVTSHVRPLPSGADVIVVGSGAAALVAATAARDEGADVVVLERSREIGGTSAVSGGVLWMPGNHHAFGTPRQRHDDAAAARRYVEALAAERQPVASPDGELVDRFVRSAGDVLARLERTTPLRTAVVGGLADYYASAGVRGACPAGRSVEPVPFDARAGLGPWADRIARRGTLLSLGAVTTLGEDLRTTRVGPEELDRRAALDVRAKGAALVSMLVRGLLDRGVRIETDARVVALATSGASVDGVVVERSGRQASLVAARGVVLACGGFEWNPSLVAEHVGYRVEPLTPPNNVGDGLLMATAIGAARSALGSYWGQPAMFDPTVRRDGEPVPQFEWARGAPSSFVVDHTGVRFANESLPYHEFSKVIGARGAATGDPATRRAWLVFDAKVKRRHRILSVMPDDEPPPWFIRADAAAELAIAMGVPPDALVDTFERFNQQAADGVDREFGRTVSGMTGPGRIAPLEPPLFALPLHPGTIGTNGGLVTDASGRVLGADGGVIDGLYAAGNTARSPLGDLYPGAGSTLGPAVTFGYLAGVAAAQRLPR